MGLLPTKKTTVQTQDPKNLILFGMPKTGKTSALAYLPNTLIIDLENGTDFISGYVVKATNYIELFNIAKELKTEKHDYKFIVIDTVTALEEMALPYANKIYRELPIGVNFDPNANILSLPNGGGYSYLRQAMQKMIDWFESLGLNIILVGHVKDKMIGKDSEELNLRTLDLTGKISNILSAKSDAIGYIFRQTDEDKVYVQFGGSGDVITGARPPHLNGQKILLSEKMEDGTLVTHWESIYPSLA